jgi:hypothetical protein
MNQTTSTVADDGWIFVLVDDAGHVAAALKSGAWAIRCLAVLYLIGCMQQICECNPTDLPRLRAHYMLTLGKNRRKYPMRWRIVGVVTLFIADCAGNIQLVEHSHLPVRRTLVKLGIPRGLSIAGMICIAPAGRMP